MKQLVRGSFKRRQLVCFLAVALLPLLITSIFLTQIVKIKVESDYEKEVIRQTEKADELLTGVIGSLNEAAKRLCDNKKLVDAIDATDSWVRNRAYTQFYEETISARQYAHFAIYDNSGSCVYSVGNAPAEQTMPVYWGILKAAREQCGELVFRRTDAPQKDNVLLRGARCIIDASGTHRGYVVAGIDESHFADILKGVYSGQEGIAILDAYWETIYSVGAAQEKDIGGSLRERLMGGESLIKDKQLPDGERLLTLEDSDGVFISPLGDTGMYKVLLRPEVFSTDVVRTMYTVILVMAVGCFILCIVVAERMSSSLTFPIKRMNSAMHKVQEGHLDTRIPVDRQDELGQMSENFNIMANKLEDYMEQQVRAQQELNASHIAMMQAQMNPHFLYNTLDTMKWLAKANHIPEIATMSTGLARILRTSISAEQFIHLQEELELVSSYTEIQKIRYGGSFCYEVEMPEQLGNAIVPKLVVQPIVENAVIHGLEDCEDGLIRLTVCQSGSELHIEVWDNGCGIEAEIMECLNSRDRERLAGHIGFYNVDTIIRLHYGEAYGLHVERPKEGGTLVCIRLPLRWE